MGQLRLKYSSNNCSSYKLCKRKVFLKINGLLYYLFLCLVGLPKHLIPVFHLSQVGHRTVLMLEEMINHVTVMGSMINLCDLRQVGIEIIARDPVLLVAGIGTDVVMRHRRVAETARYMGSTTVSRQAVMTPVEILIVMVEVEVQEMTIVNEAQNIDSVEVQVLTGVRTPPYRLRAPNGWSTTALSRRAQSRVSLNQSQLVEDI